jgi:gas vesicle protein
LERGAVALLLQVGPFKKSLKSPKCIEKRGYVMSTKEAYKQKIEAELELAQAKLAEFKAQAKISTADARIKHAKLVDEIEQRVGATKTKLKELGEASEDAWEQLKDGVESAWGSLSTAIRNAAARFKD